MRDAACTIVQKRLLGGRQTLTLDGTTLKVECRRALSLHEYRFDLRGFLPDPVRVKTVPLARIIVASILGAVSIAFIVTGILSTTDDQRFGAIFAGLVFLLLTIVVCSSIPKMMANVVLFQGPGGRAALWPDRPSKTEFSEFVAEMSTRIREAGSHEQHLLRRLRLAEIINDWQYDQAMELLRQQDDRPNPP